MASGERDDEAYTRKTVVQLHLLERSFHLSNRSRQVLVLLDRMHRTDVEIGTSEEEDFRDEIRCGNCETKVNRPSIGEKCRTDLLRIRLERSMHRSPAASRSFSSLP